MSFVSYSFMMFVAVCLVCSLIFCRGREIGRRSGVLFVASLLFLWFSGGLLSLAVYSLSALTVWAGALGVERAAIQSSKKKGIFWTTLLCNLVILAGFKYLNFPGYSMQELSWITGREEIFSWDPIVISAPVAISFYTLTLLGYLIEVYWGVERAEKSFWRVALFGGFFAQMSTGPVARWKKLSAALFEEKVFVSSFTLDIFLGLRRCLWGLFKKLVISERLAVVVNTVYGDYSIYTGSFLVLAAVCFTLQLYTDFSGAIDIALGVARMFGVRLDENFQRPFTSRSIAEFWRRWHITLGSWFKDFVMYPLMRTQTFEALARICKKMLGRKAGRRMTTAVALFIVWFLLGLWHGGMWTFIIGSGLYHAFLMSLALLSEPLIAGFYKKTGLDKDNPLWVFWQQVRTFVLVSIGFVFFRSDSLKMAFGIFKGMASGNMRLFTEEGFQELGLAIADWSVLAAALVILWVVSAIQERKEKSENVNATEKIRDVGIVAVSNVEWKKMLAGCTALAFTVIIFGFYGRGYDAAAFIYAAF